MLLTFEMSIKTILAKADQGIKHLCPPAKAGGNSKLIIKILELKKRLIYRCFNMNCHRLQPVDKRNNANWL